MSKDNTAAKQAVAISKNGHRRAGIYTRVSTDEQADRGRSLPTQLEACRVYARAHGFTVVAELPDDCSGEIPVAERPKGRELYKLADSGEIDAVILFTHDRTARDDKVIEYILLKAHLFEKGVELHYSDTGLDPYTMEGNLVGYIKAYGATEEKKKIRERTMRGRAAKASGGKYVGVGNTPYGYRKLNGQLVIDESEAQVVKQVYADYIGGKTGHAIAKELSEVRIPTPGESRGYIRKCANGIWDKKTVYALLDAGELYAGTWRYGKRDYRTGKKREIEETIPVSVPAIISPAVREKAKEQRERNKQMSKRNNKVNQYLMRGRIQCSCGKAMVGSPGNSRGVLYYRCCLAYRPLVRAAIGCKEGMVQAGLVDTKVWDWLVNLFDVSTDDGAANIKCMVAEMNKRRESAAEPTRQRSEMVNSQIDQAERQIKNLASTIADLKSDDDPDNEAALAALTAQLKTAGKRRGNLVAERDTLTAKLATIPKPEPYMEFIRDVWSLLRDLKNPSYETRRRWLERLDVRGQVRTDADGKRWVDVSCGLKPGMTSLPLSVIESEGS